MLLEGFVPDTRDREIQVGSLDHRIILIFEVWCENIGINPLCSELISPDCMSIPAGWLCYLSPEVIRELRIHQAGGEDLPFTR